MLSHNCGKRSAEIVRPASHEATGQRAGKRGRLRGSIKLCLGDHLVPQDGDLRQARYTLLEELQQLGAHLRLVEKQARKIAAGPRDAGDPPSGDRVGFVVERNDDGIVLVASRAARVEYGFAVTMAATGSAASSRATAGRRSSFPWAYRISTRTFLPCQ